MTWKTPANIPQMLANTCKRPQNQISCSLGCFVSASSNLLLSDGNAPCFIQTIWVSCLLEKRLIVANAKKIIGTGGSRYDNLYIYILLYYYVLLYVNYTTIILLICDSLPPDLPWLQGARCLQGLLGPQPKAHLFGSNSTWKARKTGWNMGWNMGWMKISIIRR